jgi:uncharacterized membrane protein
MQLFRQRNQVFEQFQQGKIDDLESECRLQNVFPTHNAWALFLNYFSLFVGAAFIIIGVLFFVAFNWSQLGRFDKLGLIQLAMIVALVLLAHSKNYSIDKKELYRRTYLFVFSCLTGILFGLIGQIYQTGADTYQLFALWSLAILPFTWFSRCQFHWLLWIGITNIAASLYINLYFSTFFRFSIYADTTMQWFLVLFNGSIIVIWHWLYSKITNGQQPISTIETADSDNVLTWTKPNLVVNILNIVVGISMTMLGIEAVFSNNFLAHHGLAVFMWVAWAASVFYYYRHQQLNRFILSGLCLSIIVMAVAIFIEGFKSYLDLFGFFVVSMFIIVGSTLSVKWLRALKPAMHPRSNGGGSDVD